MASVLESLLEVAASSPLFGGVRRGCFYLERMPIANTNTIGFFKMTDLNSVSTGSNVEEKPKGNRASRARRAILLSAALAIVLAAAGFVAVNSDHSKKSLSGALVETVSEYKNVVTFAGGRRAGPDANQLREPRGLAVGRSGWVYVADTGNNRVQKWSP